MKFRKKPVIVHAEQWLGTEESMLNIQRMLQARPAANSVGFNKYESPVSGEVKVDLAIKTLESGPLDVQRPGIGDWIISGVNLEVYACKPDIFIKTHDVEAA